LTHVDIVFANESEANTLLNCPTHEALEILSSYPYCSKAVIFQGELGAMVRSRNQPAFSSPAIIAQKVDSTGCGDSFIGGFLHGLLHNRTIEECAWLGNFLGGTAVGLEGAEIPNHLWPSLIHKIRDHLS
jgi:sugar/nucleoside kinase (ribokinase family)